MKSSGGKKRLGRGLEALLGPTSTTRSAEERGELRHIPLASLKPNRYQPRQSFDQKALDELKSSLESSGLLQPVVVRELDGGFELIAGERRSRAARDLGWETIGAVVRDVDDQTMLTLALVENIQRDSLSPIDEAMGYKKLIDEFSVSQGQVGEMVGKSRSGVANTLRLLNLPKGVRELVHSGKLSAGHARALLQFKNEADMIDAAARMVESDMSVRQAESLAQQTRSVPPAKRSRKNKSVDPEIRRLEDVLRRHLQTDVSVTARSKSSGKVSINFYSNEDLTRLLELILGRPYEG